MRSFARNSGLGLGFMLIGASNAVVVPRDDSPTASSPVAHLSNGSYYGIHSPEYDEDWFLGMPFAQPPVGDLRLRVPRPLNATWSGLRNATAYSPECIGYGEDQTVLGNYIDEDCLYLNVFRPAGVAENASLPVVAWIYGGKWTEGGTVDQRYNLSFIVQQSMQMGQPIIGVTMNYRLSFWGFMNGREVFDEGSTNLGLRDQRLSLQWIQENIDAFGGDPSNVTIWGVSAGAASVGAHLVAYRGRDDKLFKGAIGESGFPNSFNAYQTAEEFQPSYDAIVAAANCSGVAANDTLGCLRGLPWETLSDIFNSSVTANATVNPVIDGDLLEASGVLQMQQGRFVRVPYLAGCNSDEGTSFVDAVVNTTEQFRSVILGDIVSGDPNGTLASRILDLYPDDPDVGIPRTLDGRPGPDQLAQYGFMYKRNAAYEGDKYQHAPRRLTAESWARHTDAAFYSYRFDVLAHGTSYMLGATHVRELPFTMDDVLGVGWDNANWENPFKGEPANGTFVRLATMMSRMVVSFVNSGDPNGWGATTGTTWPRYTLDDPRNMVFDVNVTGLTYVERDGYREEAIAFLMERLYTNFRR